MIPHVDPIGIDQQLTWLEDDRRNAATRSGGSHWRCSGDAGSAAAQLGHGVAAQVYWRSRDASIHRRTRPSSTGSGTLPPPRTTSWNAR